MPLQVATRRTCRLDWRPRRRTGSGDCGRNAFGCRILAHVPVIEPEHVQLVGMCCTQRIGITGGEPCTLVEQRAAAIAKEIAAEHSADPPR